MLLKPLLRNFQAQPNLISISDDSGSYTNQQLGEMTFGLASLILKQTDRATVGILLPSCAGFVASFYATLLAGKIPVPINFLLSPREVGHIIQDSGFDTIIAHPMLAGKLEGLPVKVIDISTAKDQINPEEACQITPATHQPDEIATILYTSGTSGLPKGVELTHNNIHSCARACIDRVAFTQNHKFLGIVPLFHSTGLLATMVAPIDLGASVHYIARFSPVATIKAIREHGISVMAAVPSMYGALLRLKDASKHDFASMYAALSGGEPLASNVREHFTERFGIPLLEGYGLTETCGPMAFNSPNANCPGSVGQIINTVDVRISDDNNQRVPQGQVGEVQMRGLSIMKNYHNLPDVTAQVTTSDGYFRSGDLGKIDENGYLHITGRLKDLIIISGEKVYPRELEELINQHPDVAETAIIGRKDESRGEVVVAFIIAKPDHTLTPESIREFCRSKDLPNWKTPKDVYVVTDLPRSPTGKVLKRELAQKLT